MVNIFELKKKEKINATLMGLVIELAGMPKVGKSTVAADAPDPIFLATENGTAGLTNMFVQPIASWSDFVQAVNQLCTPQAHDMVKTVVIDSATQLLTLLEKYEGSRQSTDKVTYQFASDMDYGKGNKGMKLLLGTQLQKLANEGYLILLITHCEEKSDFNSGRTYIGSSLSNAIHNIVSRLVDQTVYLDKKESKNTNKIEYRAWFNSKGGFADCGGRFSPEEDWVPTSYKNIEAALLKAIEKSAESRGAETNDEETAEITQIPVAEEEYNYNELMLEFNNITSDLMAKNSDLGGKIAKSVASVLGPNRKASSLTPGQAELLNEVVNTLKRDFELD